MKFASLLRSRKRVAAAVAAHLLVVYVGAFYACRRSTNATYWVNTAEGPRFATHGLHWFPGDPTAARSLYLVFLPLHRSVLGGIDGAEFDALTDAQMTAGRVEVYSDHPVPGLPDGRTFP